MKIANTSINKNSAPYIVAELSANHGGEIDVAKRTIAMAKRAGANAVKLQTYTPDTMTLKSEREDFHISEGLWQGYQLYDLYAQAHTPYEWHKPLFDYANDIGITIFSTPFDESAIELLQSLNAPAYKVASFEVLDLPLLEAIASTGKPVILSTGLANETEINEAVETLKSNGTNDLIILHCISSYPAPTDQANVRTIQLIQQQWPDAIVGLSDHTMTNSAAVAAVALGARFIEKHVILDRNMGGPDSSFSLEENQLSELVTSCQEAYLSLGKASFELKAAEQGNLKFRRSLYIAENLKAGDVLTQKNLRRIRPGYGLNPRYYHQLLGKRVTQDIETGMPMRWEFVESMEKKT